MTAISDSTHSASPHSGTDGQFAAVDLAGLRVGANLRTPIYEDRKDKRLVLLLASGTTLTESLLTRLKRRGIASVRVHRSELKRVVDAGSEGAQQPSRQAQQAIERAEAQQHRAPNSRWTCSADSFMHRVNVHGTTAYDADSRVLFSRKFQSSVAQVEELFDGLSHGNVADAAPLAAVSSESLLRIADDLDLFVATGLEPATDKYPMKHSLQTAMLAMSIGTILGLKRDELIELGIGCLVHDAGMLQIQADVVNANRALSRIEFLEITKHPTLTFDALRDVKDVPNGSRLVAYQMHERLNGSGYPRRRTANQIHHLAKIASVADVFVALLSPRPHRPGLLPYHAMEQVLHGAGQGLFEPAVVRALLHTVSLFPIGSKVEISDGRVATVLRANRDAYAAPMIEFGGHDSSQATEIIDLRRERGLKIVGVAAESSAAVERSA